MFNNFIEYSDAVLNVLSPSDLERIVENCFTSKTKNYELLAKITPKLGEYQLCPFHHAIRILEADAVKVMLENYSEDALNIIKNSINSEYYPMLLTVWEQTNSAKHIDMTITERKEKIVMIAKQLFNLKENITESDLRSYAEVAPLIDFHKLLLEKKVDLSQMNLTLPQYEILEHKPLLKGMNYNSIEDILLMHTYAQNKTQQEVRTIYTNLLNNSKIASDIMHFTAINLVKGDDLKIIFTPNEYNFNGGYAPLNNIIAIGEMFGKFTFESVMIHELGHYVLFSAFPASQGTPFDLSKLRLLQTTPDDIYGYHLNNKKTSEDTTKEIKFFKEAHKDLDTFLKYEQGAKEVFTKAGELLGLKRESFEPYVLSKDFILFLKDNSFIDLFMHNLEIGFGNPPIENNLSRVKVFAEAYHSYAQGIFEDTCPNQLPKTWYNPDIKFQDMVIFTEEQYFPYIIEKLSLNEDKIWFLERIAELLNRAKDIYDCPSSYFNEECNYSAYYQELAVRYAELKASGTSQELLNSFSGIAQAWEEGVTPTIDQARTEFLAEQKLVDFSYYAE
jgi:hypothetical protein